MRKPPRAFWLLAGPILSFLLLFLLTWVAFALRMGGADAAWVALLAGVLIGGYHFLDWIWDRDRWIFPGDSDHTGDA